ncbi:2,3-bisphosphoglycerate-independent phosphoglycerate mutase [Gangjinia marincola]|uniref:2,3-bisphosphoglycerate-independent phosphoglycerate mutase n=1 Tax=Gangjinia marincola TaxID=578463 RepID=A0ABP3XUW6_9FLAO
MSKKVLLAILDGWGISPDPSISAIDKAKTPFIDSLYTNYPNATLRTDGMNVGLPQGQMGNSEVGHMNLGAGRIVYQDLAKINKAVTENTLKDEHVLKKAFAYAKENNRPVHFLGLLGDGGVHSHINHLKGLLTAAEDFGVSKKYVHAFTDGRDVDPKSGIGFIEELLPHLSKTNAALATITGRYYAMDRDQRWERIKLAYDALVNGQGEETTHPLEAMQKSYDNGITDEFIKPIVLTNNTNNPVAKIKQGDVVVFFNFRTDRGRQLTQALTQQDFASQDMLALDLYYVTMTTYDESFTNIHVVFTKDNITNTLGEVLERQGKTQLRAAETEKYPHVTFFFSGGREDAFEGESRILVNSPKVATYDLQPEMSAPELTAQVVKHIQEETPDFICLNFANADMVGHTGDFDAAVKACETVDSSLKQILEIANEKGYTSIIIADHGNSDTMINPDGTPNTAHTTNPVPFILVDKEINKVKDGILGDIAPTVLSLMGVQQPQEMTQHPLI